MTRGKKDLDVAKAGYREAVERGDCDEQARWANQVGHACKERGQYVEALKWFRKDYEISTKKMVAGDCLPGNLMPTCQSMGEIYLRLNDFEQALVYQRKHYQLAEETDNLTEQQRASTQLGRTYVEIYEQKDDFSALQNAKEYLKIAMDLARTLKENPPSRDSPSFVKELIDAYNNMGLLMMVIDDHRQAANYFQQGLKICDEEEVQADDDARSRLHHNLGRLHCERREWDKAKYHTQMDISICQRIPHPQGEAKGFINLGEIHFKRQKYEEARRCFDRALEIALALEDEDELVRTAQKNLEVVGKAEEKLSKLAIGEQRLKKLQRKKLADGKISHNTEEYKLLNELIGLAEDLQAWEKHLKLAKRLKMVVKEMGDMEKLSDALEIVGESHYNLRNFTKSKKWHLRSWDLCKRIGHLEGQSVAMINCGNALDFLEDWENALKAYRDAYKIAKSQGKTRMLSQQINALENMHYCYFVRLERMAEAKAIHSKLQILKELRDRQETCAEDDEHCSETDNDADSPSTTENTAGIAQTKRVGSKESKYTNTDVEDHVDYHSLSSVQPRKDLYKVGKEAEMKVAIQVNECLQQNHINQSQAGLQTCRKRPRVVLIDEEEVEESFVSAGMESVAHSLTAKEGSQVQNNSSNEVLGSGHPRIIAKKANCDGDTGGFATEVKERTASKNNTNSLDKDVIGFHPIEQSESSELGSVKFDNPASISNSSAGGSDKFLKDPIQSLQVKKKDSMIVSERTASPVMNEVDSMSKQVADVVIIQIESEFVNVNVQTLDTAIDTRTVDWLKQEILNMYDYRNPAGLKPLIRYLALRGRILQPSEKVASILTELDSSDKLEAIVDGWIPVPLVERYEKFCQIYQQEANLKVMNRLMENKDIGEKIDVSGCDLDDNAVWPLLMALSGRRSFSHLDFSHNFLSNQSMQKIQEMITSDNQPNLGLILDFHNNLLGAVSVGHICESPIMMSRLEVLNLSANKLTDTAARYLAEFLRNSRALEVLKLEDCCLTTRSIMKISSAIGASCPLVKLSIGKNNPISCIAIIELLGKLSNLRNFSELDITGINLDKQAVQAVGNLLKSSHTITTLLLGDCCIQNQGMIALMDAIGVCFGRVVKLDVSSCELNLDVNEKLCGQVPSFSNLTFLNLSGNRLGEKGVQRIGTVLSSMDCRLKVLMLQRCQLSWAHILLIMKAVQGSTTLQQLILSGNNVSLNLESDGKERAPGSDAIRLTNMDSKLVEPPNTPMSCIVAGVANGRHRCTDNSDALTARGLENVVVDKGRDNLEELPESEEKENMNERYEGSHHEFSRVDVVSDSEDDSEELQFLHRHALSKASSSIRGRDSLVKEFATALARNEGLKVLDMSDNGLREGEVERLFVGWAAPTRWVHQPKKHAMNTVVHFTADNEQCCARRPCCAKSAESL